MVAKTAVGELHGVITQDTPSTSLAIPDNGGQITALMRAAVDRMDGQNATGMVEALKGMYDLYERDQKRQAEKAFNRTMAEFQAECPQILKDSIGKIVTDKGQFSYKYAELDKIDDAIRPLMTRLGLSKRFTQDRKDDWIKVTCIVSHIDGHSESSSFECPFETKAGMSPQQKIAAADTFAQRYALVAALGLTMTKTDTDAQQHVDRNPEKITSEQAAQIAALIDETQTDMGRFLAYFKIERVADLTTAQFPEAARSLEKKRAL